MRRLADYYERVGRVMVRHVRDRPVAMHVFPSGIEAARAMPMEMTTTKARRSDR